jgi:D-glycero-D-manno-heptose 1,7-bisphosphate phosphatase
MSAIRQAVVLVGGKGTRLGALARLTPKPLMQITAERRFLDYLLQAVAEAGVEEILLLAGHLGDRVEAAYEGVQVGSARLSVVREPAPAGTAGALRRVRDRLDPVFLMANGDSFFDIDYGRVASALGGGDLGVLALRRVEDGRRYGAVEQRDGRVLGFYEKDASRTGPVTVSAGVYGLSRGIVDRIGDGPASIETDVFPGLVAEGRLGAVEFDGYFIDIGLPDTLEQARTELPRLQRFAV